jgi:hypothetical protein
LKGSLGSEVRITLNDTFPPPALPPSAAAAMEFVGMSRFADRVRFLARVRCASGLSSWLGPSLFATRTRFLTRHFLFSTVYVSPYV